MRIVFLIIAYLLASLTSRGQQLSIAHLTGDCYIYTTWHTIDSGPYPANGMYVVTNAGVVLLDAPWDSTQVQPLLDTIQARHHKKVLLCIATHFHSDRTGSFNTLKRLGVATYSSKQTLDLCIQHHEQQAAYYFVSDTTFTIGDKSFSTYHPGAGHTQDNILIWYAPEKILYGGCFIKSTETNDIGNVADADINAWEVSVKKVMKKYPHPKYVIPGHLGWDNKHAVKHTLKVVRKNKE